MEKEDCRARIYRFDPSVDKEPSYVLYTIPWENWHERKVLDVLKYIYENLDPGLSFRNSCDLEWCGCCTLRVNGKSVLACGAAAEREMVIEPLPKHKVLKDLVVERRWEPAPSV